MKKAVLRMIAGALVLMLLLSAAACRSSGKPGSSSSGNSLKKYALASAAYPDLPEVPDHQSMMEKLNALDHSKLGEQYYTRYDAIVSDYQKKLDKYQTVLQEFKAAGTADPQYTAALSDYTDRTAAQIFHEYKGRNIVFSPSNFFLALSMLAETTGTESREEILQLIGVPTVEEARSLANAVFRTTYRLDGAGRTLLANSLWLSDALHYHQEVADVLAKEHFASSYTVPMGKEETDLAVRQWIDDNTANLLEDASAGIHLPDSTVAALVSTLYFKDNWRSPFSEAKTSGADFTDRDGTKHITLCMHKDLAESTAFHSEEGHYTVSALPFESGASMVFLLPDEGVSLDELLEKQLVTKALLTFPDPEQQEPSHVKWLVPKFDIDADLSLIDTLKALGVTSIFDETTSDFSPLLASEDTGPVTVSTVKHAARVKVSEEGCEAAAFTLITPTYASLPPELPIIEMYLNRPFAFMITGLDGLPLFIGIVNYV